MLKHGSSATTECPTDLRELYTNSILEQIDKVTNEQENTDKIINDKSLHFLTILITVLC